MRAALRAGGVTLLGGLVGALVAHVVTDIHGDPMVGVMAAAPAGFLMGICVVVIARDVRR